MSAAEERRAAFLGEDRHVLVREGKSSGGRVVFDVPGTRHSAKPLSRVALVDARSLGELGAGRCAVRHERLEEAQSVSEGGQDGDGQATGVG